REGYEFAAASMSVIEKYLYGYFGGSVRSERELPAIRAPFQPEELMPEYSIGTMTFAGRQRDTLIDSSGTVVAITAADRLVELSHYLDVSVNVIKDSFLDSEGKPLFTLWKDYKG
ncbi:necrotizing toxin immunity factor IFT, partial [Mycobacterium tuberculosis]